MITIVLTNVPVGIDDAPDNANAPSGSKLLQLQLTPDILVNAIIPPDGCQVLANALLGQTIEVARPSKLSIVQFGQHMKIDPNLKGQ